MTAGWWPLIAWLPTALAAQPLLSAPDPVSHVVRAGETLWGISRAHLGNAQSWPVIRERNRLGEPRQLQIGTVLHFAEGGAHAVVVAASGDVWVAEEGGKDEAQPSKRLSKGALVRTGPDGFVTLRLPDGSLCTLPSNSSVRLVRFVTASGDRGVVLDLQAGEVESRVPPQPSAQEVFRVRTRMATVGVRGTHFRVSLTDQDRVAVSVLESRVAVQAEGQPEILVPALQGVAVGGNLPAGAVMALLPAPDLADEGQPQNQPGVLLAWHEVEGADSYHAQIARDAGFLDLVAEQRTERSGKHELALFDGIAPGSYFARVAAVTSDGVEGRAAMGSFSRRLASQSPGGGSARWQSLLDAIEFEWEPVPGALHCLEIADDPGFLRMVVKADGLEAHTVRVQALPPGQYYWRSCAAVIAHGQRAVTFGPVQPLWVEGVR